MEDRINMVRTGDVMLRRVERIPPSATENRRVDRIIVAEGEVTGHMHTLEGTAPFDVLTTDEGQMYIDMKGPGTLTHDEHLTRDVDAGTWKVIRQSEYTREEYRVQTAD
jgi:hypothetical protein